MRDERDRRLIAGPARLASDRGYVRIRLFLAALTFDPAARSPFR